MGPEGRIQHGLAPPQFDGFPLLHWIRPPSPRGDGRGRVAWVGVRLPKPYLLSLRDIPLPTGRRAYRRTPQNTVFLHRGIAANVDVVGAVLGYFLVLLGPSWNLLWCSCGLLGLRLQVNGSTGSGSVAGSGAQPLLDNNNIMIIYTLPRLAPSSRNHRGCTEDTWICWGCSRL